MSGSEIADRGKQLYEQRLRALVEREENIGRFISVDVETGEYEIGDDLVVTGQHLHALPADAAIYGRRIGYRAAFALSSPRCHAAFQWVLGRTAEGTGSGT